MTRLTLDDKFKMLLKAGRWKGKKPTSGLATFRCKNATPFVRCLESCFGNDEKRMMAAWKLGNYEYGRYNSRCVKGAVPHTCKLRDLEAAALAAEAAAADGV